MKWTAGDRNSRSSSRSGIAVGAWETFITLIPNRTSREVPSVFTKLTSHYSRTKKSLAYTVLKRRLFLGSIGDVREMKGIQQLSLPLPIRSTSNFSSDIQATSLVENLHETRWFKTTSTTSSRKTWRVKLIGILRTAVLPTLSKIGPLCDVQAQSKLPHLVKNVFQIRSLIKGKTLHFEFSLNSQKEIMQRHRC